MLDKLYLEETDKELLLDYKNADKFMLKLIFLHWILVSTASAYFYDAYLLGFFGGGILFLTTFVAYNLYTGTPIFRIIVSLVIITFTIISIQQNFGRIEFHFHVFIALSFLTVYKDLMPATVASIYVIIHHLFFTYLQLQNVYVMDIQIVLYNYGCGYDIAILHAVYVLFEYIVLFRIVTSNINNFKDSNKLKNQLRESNTKLNKEKIVAINATKAKSEFLANMSHEIRTPLNAMMGFVDIIKEKESKKQNKEYLDIIKSSGDSLMGIINDILDFSKIESGNVKLEVIPYNLKKTVREIGLLFFEKAKEKKIDIKLYFDKDLPNTIDGDPIRLKQITSNIIGNAIKFTPIEGIIHMNVKYDNKSKQLTFEIKDNGIGIAKENIEKILKPFEQEDASTTRKFGGTGLGLSISSNLVKLMGGELKVKSELGKGSMFYFSIPIIENTKEIKTTKKEVVSIDSKSLFSSKNILLVEDSKTNQMYMKVLLEDMGLKSDLANDGIEAVDKFKTSKYDLVLMDENMPNMNGIEATKNILEYEKENNLAHTPIIALTANALKGDREIFLNAGMDEYVTKPINKEILLKVLIKTLK